MRSRWTGLTKSLRNKAYGRLGGLSPGCCRVFCALSGRCESVCVVMAKNVLMRSWFSLFGDNWLTTYKVRTTEIKKVRSWLLSLSPLIGPCPFVNG